MDLILAGMVFEAAALVFWPRRGSGGTRGVELLPNLLSGMCLLLALRVALGGGWWGWMAACLLGALLGHVADLSRLRR